jgi:23S rRNA pseudouridine2605 synthase
MRINRFVALATGMSRRAADRLADSGELHVNGKAIRSGQEVDEHSDVVTHRGRRLKPPRLQTIMLNKPPGYVCSREGQGAKTIYELLPEELAHLKPVGRLDKDSSGLLLLTNDGTLAQRLTHPSFQKTKIYQVALDQPLAASDATKLASGVQLEDGPSKLALAPLGNTSKSWQIKMQEGRNRQIRRTLAALGYQVQTLHRTQFGSYELGNLAEGRLKPI